VSEYETRAAAEAAFLGQISDAQDEAQNGNLEAAAMWAGLASSVYLVEIEPWKNFPADKLRNEQEVRSHAH
jgi:hypothetical protein